MRKICLFIAMLGCMAMQAQMSGKLRIPSVDHLTITVSRNGTTLSSGDIVTSGDELVINYAVQSPYRFEGESSVTVTLTDAMFEADMPNVTLRDQGWAYSPNGSWLGHTGWSLPMFYGAVTGTKSGYTILEETGPTQLAFVWDIEQGGKVENGKFILTCSLNGTVVKTHDFTSTAHQTGDFIEETVSYVGDGNDTIVWACEKTEGATGQTSRSFFVGDVNYVGSYRYLVAAPTVLDDLEVIFEEPDQVILEATLNNAPFTGGAVHIGDKLYYSYTITSPGWIFESGDPVNYSDALTLAEDDFDSNGKLYIAPPTMHMLTPAISIEIKDASSALISWDGYGVYETYRLVIATEQLSGNPQYWKGMQHLTDTFYLATGLAEGTTYYVHLEASVNGTATDWSVAPFLMEMSDPCKLTIEMQDYYGDGWNGGGFYFVEDGDSTFFTVPSGYSNTATYNSYGDTVQIVWEAGSYPNEISFIIRDGLNKILYRMDRPEGQNHYTGEVLLEDVLCKPLCSLSNLEGTAEGTHFNITWEAEGATSYDVAVLQIENPTDKQLDSAKVNVKTMSYSFEGLAHHGYNVYVRPINTKGLPLQWHNILVYEKDVLADLALLPEYAQEITVSSVHTGTMLEDAVWTNEGYGDFPLLVYSFTLEDSTDIIIRQTSDKVMNYLFTLFKEENGNISYVDDGSELITRLKGHYYLTMSSLELGAYRAEVLKPMQPRVVASLDFLDAGDFSDGDFWSHPAAGDLLAKCFSFTPSDTIRSFSMMLSSNTDNNPHGYAIYRNEINPGTEQELYSPRPWFISCDDMELLKDSTYYFLVLCDPLNGCNTSDTYTLSLINNDKKATPLIPVALALNDTVTGHFDDAAVWEFPMGSTMVYAKAFSITLAATTEVKLFFNTPDWKPSMNGPSHYYLLFKDSISENHWDGIIGTGSPNNIYPEAMTLKADTTYIFVICALPPYGGMPTDSFMVSLMDASLAPVPEPLPFKTITLDYVEKGDFTDADEWIFPYTGETVLAKAFAVTPDKEVQVEFTYDSPDLESSMLNISMYYFIYRDTITGYPSDIYMEGMPSSFSEYPTVPANSTFYFIICTLPTYGGKASDRYTLSLTDPSAPTTTVKLTSDTLLVDKITEVNRIKEWDAQGKVYEFVLTENTTISYSFEYTGNDPDGVNNLYMYLYEDNINSSSLSEYWAGRTEFYTEDLEGYPFGMHYYLVVRSTNTGEYEYRIHFRTLPDYDHLPVKGEISLNRPNQSVWTLEDGFHYGNFEAYQVALEKDKVYRIMSHPTEMAGTARDFIDFTSISLFMPGAQKGNYYENLDNEEWGDLYSTDWWAVMGVTSNSTVMDTVMFTAYSTSKSLGDSITYEFSVEEVIGLSDLMYVAPEVEDDAMPHTETGIFADNNKVIPDYSRNFHSDTQSYLEEYGAYDALARQVSLGSGDTLFVEFGGDIDASIHFYDMWADTLIKVINDLHDPFPYEKGYIVNETAYQLDVIVVCSFNQVILKDAAWSLRISKSEKDLEPVVVTPKANQESVTIHESDGIAEALDALSQLILSAIDGEENIVATLANNRFGWDVDLVVNTASYELNDMDLPAGFVFANPTMFIEVEIERIPDLPTGFIDGIANDPSSVLKILCDDQVYIIRDGVIYNIMGQRVK